MELLDIVDEQGNPTGRTVERKKAHREGIRHRSSHVWLLRKKEGQVEILLQKRSNNKDSFPGCYDISSAGHIPAGTDYITSALRELQEELGVEVEGAKLKYCGKRFIYYEEVFYGEPFIDNQVSNIYILWLDRETEDFTLQEEEVEEVRWFGFEECVELVRQNRIPHCIMMEELEMLRKGIARSNFEKYILIVEDDISLANGLCRVLASPEVKTESCGTLEEAAKKLAQAATMLAAGENKTMPLLLLDVNLPDGNGFDFLKTVKEAYDISVIMLTANDMETDIVAGLEQGADDYITKPFSLAVLRARVAAVLRRMQCKAAGEESQRPCPEIPVGEWRKKQPGRLDNENHIVFDNYDFDFEKMLFCLNGQAVELSKTEQRLLRYFVRNRGITLSRDILIDRVWTDGAEYVDDNVLSVTVKRLRDKLSAHQYIKTVYGVGYVWKKEQQKPYE